MKNLDNKKILAISVAIAAAVSAIGVSVNSIEYTATVHEAIRDAGSTTDEMTDLLSEPVKPGEVVSTEVNVALGKRPDWVDFVGDAAGKFTLQCTAEERCGLSFSDQQPATIRDGTTPPGVTTIRLTAKNTSQETIRLSAFLHYSTPIPGDAGL